MALTDKQRAILLKDGFSSQAIEHMSYDEASKRIGEILGRPKEEKKVTSDKPWPKKASNGKKEYHLTPEAVKIAALNVTLETVKISPEKQDNFWSLVKNYEDYINGIN